MEEDAEANTPLRGRRGASAQPPWASSTEPTRVTSLCATTPRSGTAMAATATTRGSAKRCPRDAAADVPGRPQGRLRMASRYEIFDGITTAGTPKNHPQGIAPPFSPCGCSLAINSSKVPSQGESGAETISELESELADRQLDTGRALIAPNIHSPPTVDAPFEPEACASREASKQPSWRTVHRPQAAPSLHLPGRSHPSSLQHTLQGCR